MLTNHWNTLKICLFGQTTKQLLSLSSENLENISNFEGWGLTLVTYKKCTIENFDKIKYRWNERPQQKQRYKNVTLA